MELNAVEEEDEDGDEGGRSNLKYLGDIGDGSVARRFLWIQRKNMQERIIVFRKSSFICREGCKA